MGSEDAIIRLAGRVEANRRKVRDTSVISYEEIDNISMRQRQVLSKLEELNRLGIYPTDRELADYMGYRDPNNVRPRRHELVDAGLVVESGKRRCKISNRVAYTWRVKKK